MVYDDGYYRIEIESVDEIEIAAGESFELVSQTMDSGINLIISYE